MNSKEVVEMDILNIIRILSTKYIVYNYEESYGRTIRCNQVQ